MRERLETDNTYGWRMAEYDAGVHLHRTDENTVEIDALADLLGGRVGVEGVLGDLNRRARRSPPWGRAVHRAYTWDAEDRRTPQWWPQGISTSADASESEEVAGRRVVAVSWYAKETDGVSRRSLALAPQPTTLGCRVTFLDLDTLRYRHVLLVVPGVPEEGCPTLEPLSVHAGGIVWCGQYLHIAATAKGFMTCRLDDILQVPDNLASGDTHALGVSEGRVSSFGYRYLLPVRFTYRAGADEGQEKLRYSFLSLDRSTEPPHLLAGEYGNSRQTRRLAHFPLDGDNLLVTDEDGLARPHLLADGGQIRTQGAVVAGGQHYLTVSKGQVTPGSVYAGRPGSFRKHTWATPIGPEDITYWPSTDLLWSVTEHPRRRWVYAMRRAWFD